MSAGERRSLAGGRRIGAGSKPPVPQTEHYSDAGDGAADFRFERNMKSRRTTDVMLMSLPAGGGVIVTGSADRKGFLETRLRALLAGDRAKGSRVIVVRDAAIADALLSRLPSAPFIDPLYPELVPEYVVHHVVRIGQDIMKRRKNERAAR